MSMSDPRILAPEPTTEEVANATLSVQMASVVVPGTNGTDSITAGDSPVTVDTSEFAQQKYSARTRFHDATNKYLARLGLTKRRQNIG